MFILIKAEFMKNRLILLISLMYFFLSLLINNIVIAGKYFDPAELDTISVPDSTLGDTWYVDGENGNDKNDGRTPKTAFRTLAKCLDRYRSALNGGDVVKIMAGVYHERITIANVFTSAEARLIIGPYGNGPVIIDASDTHKLVWKKYNSDIYLADFADIKIGKAQAKPNAIILDDNFKKSRQVDNISDIIAFGQWSYDDKTRKLYVHTNGDAPDSHNIIVTKFDENNVEYGIYGVGNKKDYSYIEIHGLTIIGASSWGIWLSGDHCRIEQCVVKYSGKGAIQLKSDYAEIKKNLITGNVLMNWPRGRTWDTSGGWPISLVAGSHALVSGNIVHDNGGEGIGSGGPVGLTNIHDNIVYNNWSVNIYIDNSPYHTIQKNLIYSTQPDPADMIDENKIPSWTSWEKILWRMRAQGIVLGDEKAASRTARSTGTKIINNIIVGCRTGFTHYGQADQAGLKNHTIMNNTIIIPNSYVKGEKNSGVIIPYNHGNNVNTVFKNNIIVGTNPKTPLIQYRGETDEKGIIMDNNIYFNQANKKAFILGYSKAIDFQSWRNITGQDRNSLNTDPLFLGNAGSFDSQNYVLSKKSPALDRGVISKKYSDDFYSFLRGPLWDIGAIESSTIITPQNN